MNKDMIAIQSRINHGPITKHPIKPNQQVKHQANSFKQVFEDELKSRSELKFSKHASMRIASREIQISGEDINRIEKAVNEAEKKGIKDSLLIMDDVALVVNIKSKTVVTAVKKEQQDQIFSKIDGAILL